MKLILFIKDKQLPHRKNYEAIQRMCRECSIDFEICENISRLSVPDYDILLSCNYFVLPECVPRHVKIIYGPNLFTFPSGPLVGPIQDEFVGRCVFTSLSQWVKELYFEMVPSLILPLEPLPFGVDTERFRPYDQPYEPIFDCILYVKHRSKALENQVVQLLEEKKLRYHVFRYGSYKEEDYMYGIRMSKFILVLDAHESQGFALEEAMSCNVPLLVVDATSMYDETNDGVNSIYEYLKPKKLLATSVPYWSDECGIKITNPANVSDALDNMMRNYKNFTPRNYIVRTLSDKVCMDRILDYFHLRSKQSNHILHEETSDVYTITSVIHLGNIPWSYYPKRSLFTPEQRLEQTLQTIESIRKYAPTGKILLVEASKLDDAILNLFMERCDYVYYLGDDSETHKNCISSNSKGLGDAWLMYKGAEYVKQHLPQTKNLFKVCGRYRINDSFNRTTIPNDLPTFRLAYGDNTFVTFFFSIPYSCIDEYMANLRNCIDMYTNIHTYTHKHPPSIEVYLPNLFAQKHIVHHIGAEGMISVDESYQVYRV